MPAGGIQCLDAAKQCILLGGKKKKEEEKVLFLAKITVILEKSNPNGQTGCADDTAFSPFPGSRGERHLINTKFVI